METLSFNLIDQPWIPCIQTTTGQLVEMSIRDLLVSSHHLRALACETPIHDTALMMPLLAILHRVFGPRNEQEWAVLYQQGHFSEEMLDTYFTEWYRRFDLFDQERPFYQAYDQRVKPKSVIHLIHSMGNTGAVFSHHDEAQGLTLSPAQAARSLIVAQNFRTAGLSGLEDKFTDSTLTRGVIFLATGENLFESLMLNLVGYPQPQHFQWSPEDAPCWEQIDAHCSRNIPYGYLDYLTWQSSRILLMPELTQGRLVVRQMTAAPSLRLAEDVFSPHKLYLFRGKEGEARWRRVDFSADRTLWREYETLFALDSDKELPPVAIRWMGKLVRSGILKTRSAYRVRSQGLLADQAKPIFYRDQAMPVPYSFLCNGLHIAYVEAACNQAEQVEFALKKALNTFATYLLRRSGRGTPEKTDIANLTSHWGVLTNYWTRLEPDFWNYVAMLSEATEPHLFDWECKLKWLSRTLLQETVLASGMTQGIERAEVHANHELNEALIRIFEPIA